MNVDQASCQKARAKPHGRRGFGQTEVRRRRNFGEREDGLYRGVHRKCRKAVVSVQCSVFSVQFRLLGFVEPCQDALFELLWSCADGAAVIGVGDSPENRIAIAGLDAAGVAWRNVAVDLTVNQKNWNLCLCY